MLVGDTPVRVLIGTAYGVTSPVKTYARTLYLEASLQAEQSLILPDGVEERGLYVVQGRLKARDKLLEPGTMTVFTCETEISVTAESATRLALIGGERLPPRYIWWNFVSNRKERIEQAKRDWREGKFAKVPGDETEFIPLPDA